MSILVKQVRWADRTVDLLTEGNRIRTIADHLDDASAHTILEGANRALLPTFHNAHNHAAMTLMRSYADDLELFTWLNDHIWPLEAKLTEEATYHGARLACLEMIKSGTTFFNDMYHHWHGTARAVEEMGLRAALAPVFFDFDDPGQAREQKKRTLQLLEERERYSDRILFALGPHAVYTVSADSLRWCNEIANEHNLMIHTHLSETAREVADCVKTHGKRPPAYLDALGVLGPRLMAAHCIHLTREEMDLLAEWGVKALHCPTSNMKLASGKLNFTEASRAGLQAAIGTDGCASNNNLDMGEEIKIAALLEKHFASDPTALDAQTAWHAGTRACAQFFGLDSGHIAEGALADFMLVNLDHPRLLPGHNLIADMVYSADSECIDTLVCNGRILMHNRRVEGEEEIIANARRFIRTWIT